jgi:signal transduction histidine kinase
MENKSNNQSNNILESEERKKYEDALNFMNQELTKKNEQLLKINNYMSDFIFAVTHDLNSPLSNIEGLISVLKLNDCYKQEEPKMMMDMMDVAVAKFKKTIKNLSDIARFHESKDGDGKDINISEALEEVKFLVKELIDESGSEITGDFSECETIPVEKSIVYSILFNLISNSLKYRHPDRKSEISIKSYNANNYTILEVVDNGLGIPEQQTSQIFNRFNRLHSHTDGAGLGLFNLKRLAESNGGKIEVISKLNEGSSFKVYLKPKLI